MRDECFYTAYKVRDWSIAIFYPIVSMDIINMFLALKNCYTVRTFAQALSIMDMNPTRRECMYNIIYSTFYTLATT